MSSTDHTAAGPGDATLPPADPDATLAGRPSSSRPRPPPRARLRVRPLPDRAPARGRRHGGRLPGPRHRPRPPGRPQGPAPRPATARPPPPRFVREAQAAAALHHPNICPVYDVGEVDGTHYLTMAYVEGEPLAGRVGAGRLARPGRGRRGSSARSPGPCRTPTTRGVIHRDLKPANIMIDRRGEPVVMDFGLARRPAGRRPAAHAARATSSARPAYMSPEQATGRRRGRSARRPTSTASASSCTNCSPAGRRSPATCSPSWGRSPTTRRSGRAPAGPGCRPGSTPSV